MLHMLLVIQHSHRTYGRVKLFQIQWMARLSEIDRRTSNRFHRSLVKAVHQEMPFTSILTTTPIIFLRIKRIIRIFITQRHVALMHFYKRLLFTIQFILHRVIKFIELRNMTVSRRCTIKFLLVYLVVYGWLNHYGLDEWFIHLLRWLLTLMVRRLTLLNLQSFDHRSEFLIYLEIKCLKVRHKP